MGMVLAVPGLLATDFVEGDKDAVKQLLLNRSRDALDDAAKGAGIV